MRIIIISCILFVTSGCATGLGKSLHEYSVLDPADDYSGFKSRKVHATGTQNVVVATGNTDFADNAYLALIAQCPGGRIVNISARSTTNLGILAFEDALFLEGTCLMKEINPSS